MRANRHSPVAEAPPALAAGTAPSTVRIGTP
jgi:hypothetical protein